MKTKKRLFQLKDGLMQPFKPDEPLEKKKSTPLKIIPIIKRKTITIHESEYNEWLKIKEEHKWTTILKTVREGYQFFKQVMANLTVKVQGGSYYQQPKEKGIERNKSSSRVIFGNKDNKKAKLLQEIKKATEGKMSIKDFRESLLKPLTKDELQNIQLTDTELEKLEKTQEEVIQLEDLKPPG